MSWMSILPDNLSYIETWITRFFFFLGAIVLFPWIGLVVYDFVVYVIRVVTYEVPVIGGRARNRPRPRAPSLSERPDGQPRELGVATGISAVMGGDQEIDDGAETIQSLDGTANRRRTTQNQVVDKSTDEQLQL